MYPTAHYLGKPNYVPEPVTDSRATLPPEYQAARAGYAFDDIASSFAGTALRDPRTSSELELKENRGHAWPVCLPPDGPTCMLAVSSLAQTQHTQTFHLPATIASRSPSRFGRILTNSCLKLAATSVFSLMNNRTGRLSDTAASSFT